MKALVVKRKRAIRHNGHAGRLARARAAVGPSRRDVDRRAPTDSGCASAAPRRDLRLKRPLHHRHPQQPLLRADRQLPVTRATGGGRLTTTPGRSSLPVLSSSPRHRSGVPSLREGRTTAAGSASRTNHLCRPQGQLLRRHRQRLIRRHGGPPRAAARRADALTDEQESQVRPPPAPYATGRARQRHRNDDDDRPHRRRTSGAHHRRPAAGATTPIGSPPTGPTRGAGLGRSAAGSRARRLPGRGGARWRWLLDNINPR